EALGRTVATLPLGVGQLGQAVFQLRQIGLPRLALLPVLIPLPAGNPQRSSSKEQSQHCHATIAITASAAPAAPGRGNGGRQRSGRRLAPCPVGSGRLCRPAGGGRLRLLRLAALIVIV